MAARSPVICSGVRAERALPTASRLPSSAVPPPPGGGAGKEIGGDGDIAGLGELVDDAAGPIGETLVFVNHDDSGGLGFDFGETDEGFHGAVAVFHGDPFEMARRFFEAGFGPILGGGGGDEPEEGGEGEQQTFHG